MTHDWPAARRAEEAVATAAAAALSQLTGSLLDQYLDQYLKAKGFEEELQPRSRKFRALLNSSPVLSYLFLHHYFLC